MKPQLMKPQAMKPQAMKPQAMKPQSMELQSMKRLQFRLVLSVAISLVGACLGASQGRCEYRHALVIGPSAAPVGAPTAAAPGAPAGTAAGTPNPSGRDVEAVAGALAKRGFTVTRVESVATVKELDDAVRAFAPTVTTGGTALVYFTGKASWAPVPQGMNPPRQELAFHTRDGNRQLLSAVLRPLVVPNLGPYGHGWQGPQSGSRMNVLIVDADLPEPPLPPPPAQANPPPSSPPTPPSTTPPPPAPSPSKTNDAAAGKAVIEPAPLPESLVILRPAVPTATVGPAASTTPPAPAAPAGTVTPSPAATPHASTVDAGGLSPLAERLVAGLNASRSLDAVLAGLSPRVMSSLAEGELARLAAPASRAVSPPTTLGPGARPGDEWVDANGMVFCWCPAGEFTIGSAADEPGRQADETQFAVSFAEGFWMAKHELCYRETLPLGCAIYLSTGENKLQPANKATGMDHAKLLTGLNAKAPPGWEYSRPTEAEWEYAARAGTTTAYSFGSNPAELARFGNFADRTLRESASRSEVAKAAGNNSPHKVYNGDLQTGLFTYAHPVWNDSQTTMARIGSYPPNPWGLCDMHGNVAELVATLYSPTRLAPFVPLEKRAEWNAKPESERFARGGVCKGGSWASLPSACRSAFRGWSSVADNIVGMRVMLRRRGAAVAPPEPRQTTLVPAGFYSSAGASATIDANGAVTVTGTATVGDTYTVTCPVPAGLEPFALRLELLADPALPKQGPGRRADGAFYVSDATIAVKRGAGPATTAEVLEARSDVKPSPVSVLLDGRPETVWGGPGDGKNHDVEFTIGVPARTGGDGARWRHPLAASQPITELVLTVTHPASPNYGTATLGKFRIVAIHDDAVSTPKESKP